MKVKGKKAVAEHFGVSVRQISNWEKDGMPGRVGNEYDLVAIAAWRDRRQGKTPLGDERQRLLSPQRGKDFEDARLKKVRAEILELDLRKRQGELVERTEVEQLFVARIMAVKQGLLSLPRSLPLELIHCQSERDMENIIREAVLALLESYSRPLPQAMSGSGSGASGG